MGTLFESYGGDSFWEAILDQLFERIMIDPILIPIFEGRDLVRVKGMVRCLLSSALKASNEYSFLKVKHIHTNLGIRNEHYNRFLLIFYNILNLYNIKEEDVEFLLVIIESFKDEVVT